MIMELPKKFKRQTAEVIDGKLFIYQLYRYEDLVYELTYASKKIKCVYCGKKLSRKNSTLDHRYPRDTGGVSITNNLYPCCPRCNSKKGNLTHEEFLKVLYMEDKRKKAKYLENVRKYNKGIFKKKGYKLPKKWVTVEEIKNIKCERPVDVFRGKKYHRIVEFYETYKKIPRAVVVDKNNFLLDGYNIILFAKDMGIKEIPVVKLDNVEFVGKKEL